MIGEDQTELADQCSSETRRLRNLQRISEAGIEEDGRALASRVLEVGADTVPGIRRVRQSLSFVPGLNLTSGEGGFKRHSSRSRRRVIRRRSEGLSLRVRGALYIHAAKLSGDRVGLVFGQRYVGGMFWLRRKKFVGSYLRLRSTSRSYFSVP